MHFKTLRDAGDVRGKRVLLREDLNVPLKDGAVGDETRIVAALETLRWLGAHGAKTVILSHLGPARREGRPKYSLRPVAARLAQHLGVPVGFVDDCIGPAAVAASRALADGAFVLFENVRFHAEEEANDPGVRRRARAKRRPLRQRRVRHRTSRARIDGRRRRRPARVRRLSHGSGARGARAAHRAPGPPVRLRDRRSEGGRQGRRVRAPARTRRRVRDRRRDGEHVSRRRRHGRRRVAARQRPRSRDEHPRACPRTQRHPAPPDRCGRRRRLRCRRDGADGRVGRGRRTR